MTITLFGATGFTGQKIASTLAREGLAFRIAGRSPAKLAALARSLPNQPEWITADATQPESLPALFRGTRLLINLAGPFTDLGERVVAQAAQRGVHYLDVTNELGYVYRLKAYDAAARQSGAALVPACGFEVALADCLAHRAGVTLTGGEAFDPDSDPIDSVDVLYQIRGSGSSRGTRRSAVRSLATSWFAYRGGRLTGAVPGGSVKTFRLVAAKQTAFSFPSSESLTLPSHLPLRRVDTWMAAPPSAKVWAPVLIPFLARLSRSVLRGLILKLAEAGGTSPESHTVEPGLRENAGTYTILVIATRASQQVCLSLSGLDPYGVTAEIAAYAGRVMTSAEFNQAGLLAPASVLGAEGLLDYAQKHWNIQIETL